MKKFPWVKSELPEGFKGTVRMLENSLYVREKRVMLDRFFIDKHAKKHKVSYEEAHATVMSVMITLQDLLCQESAFKLPGIGIVSLTQTRYRTMKITSAHWWWTPGFLNIVNKMPGWENAPLNQYLTTANLKSLKATIERQDNRPAAFDRVTMSDRQINWSNDTDYEFPTSLDRFEYYSHPVRKGARLLRWILTTAKRHLAATWALKTKVKELEAELQELKARLGEESTNDSL